jgi:hypothetical protein
VTELRDGNDTPLTSGGNTVSTSTTDTPAGPVATLTASAATGWHFADWRGACAGSSTSCQVLTTAARKVWATFVDDDPGVTLSVSKGGDGAGGVAAGWLGVKNGAEAGGTNLDWTEAFPRNSAVTLLASPAPDSLFSGWSGGGCSGAASSCTVNLASAASVTASFTKKPVLTVNITVDPDHQGTLSPIATHTVLMNTGGATSSCVHRCDSQGVSCTVTCKRGFVPGAQVSMTAVNSTRGYSFIGWSGDCAGNGACNVTMNADRTVTGSYKINGHVNVTLPSNGQIVMPPFVFCGRGLQFCHSLSMPLGTTFTLSADPDPGYRLSAWGGDASGCGGSAACTLTVNKSVMVVSASFVLSGECAPGAVESCCPCAGSCGCPGTRTCSAAGRWGACEGFLCGGRRCE